MTEKDKKVVKVEEKLEDITECSICYNTFTYPKILPCIHTFCLDCLQQAGEKSGKTVGNQMPCPMCRKEFTIPDNGYDGLQKNFFMERLLEIKQILNPSSGSDVCEECQEASATGKSDEQPSAEVYCTDCDQKLCSDCHTHHMRNKTSKQHHIIGLNEENTTKNRYLFQNICLRLCEMHEKRPLEFYCHNCQTVSCAVCFVENHEGHKWSDVNKISSEFREEIEGNIDSLSLPIKNLTENRDQLESCKTAFTSKAEEIEMRVNRKRNELKELVDRDADAVLLELATHRNQRLKDIDAKKDDTEALLSSFESYKSYCRRITTAGSSADVCGEVNNLRKRSGELTKQYASTSLQHTFTRGLLSLEETNLAQRLKTGENAIGTLDEYNDTEDSHFESIEMIPDTENPVCNTAEMT